jgi:hypothetical protein
MRPVGAILYQFEQSRLATSQSLGYCNNSKGRAEGEAPGWQGLMWKAAFAGHEMDPVSAETDQKRLMLERFQTEVSARICAPAGAQPGQLRAQRRRAGIERDGKRGTPEWQQTDPQYLRPAPPLHEGVVWAGGRAHTPSWVPARWGTSSSTHLLASPGCVWQNPGFDFSGAEFSGACPDPRTFMVCPLPLSTPPAFLVWGMSC